MPEILILAGIPAAMLVVRPLHLLALWVRAWTRHRYGL